MPTKTPQISGPGRRLAAARQELGLSVSEIAGRTRIPSSSITAIEDDDWIALPAPVYVRGFLRLYAQEVGLDPEAIVNDWRHLSGGGQQTPISARRTNVGSGVGWVAPVAAGLAATAAIVGLVIALMGVGVDDDKDFGTAPIKVDASGDTGKAAD